VAEEKLGDSSLKPVTGTVRWAMVGSGCVITPGNCDSLGNGSVARGVLINFLIDKIQKELLIFVR
jgi:hypothetical protein